MPHSTLAPLRRERRTRAQAITLERAAGAWLFAHIGGKRHTVRLRHCFPWAEPARYLSLRDEEEREIALVADPHELDETSRLVLEDVLAETGFLFEILRVREIDDEIELRQWRVHCTQGDRTFQTRLDEWPRTLPDGSLLIRDLTGDLYRLPGVERMDARSRKLLWAFVD